MHPRTCERGFTIIEVLIALTVLLVGLVATLALVSAANGRSTATKGREGATNLAREVSEQVRSLNYSELTPALLQARLQAKPQLADASTAAGWQITRRGFTFTVAPAVCSIDDPRDKLGDHSAGGFCADSSGEDTDDATPEDLKRIVVTTSFTDRGRTISTRSTTTVNSTSQTNGLPVNALALFATNPATAIAPSPVEPVIGTAVSQLVFRVQTPAAAAAVQWNVEGRRKMPDATRVSSTTWEFTWPITGLSDGTYGISASAINNKGEVGPAREIPVRLARNIPAAPENVVGGYNTLFDLGTSRDVAELEWTASPERNVEGYRVYRGDGSLACPADATVITTQTSCVDFSPPADTDTTAARTYQVVALYRNAANVLMETPAATKRVDPIIWWTPNPTTTATTAHAYKFANATANSAAPCAGTGRRDLLDGAFGAIGTLAGANQQLTFCAPPISIGADQTGQIPAQTASIRVNLSTVINAQGTCTITGTLLRLGTASSSTLATTSMTFTRSSNSGYFTWSPSLPATMLTNGDKLAVRLVWSNSSDCSKLTLKYGGSINPGELNVQSAISTTTYSMSTTRPNPPTNLVAVNEADGTVKLTWNKPVGGPPVEFYRIYRNSQDYTNRLTTALVDATGGATTDTEFVNGGPATYWVTAVSPGLTESTFSNWVEIP